MKIISDNFETDVFQMACDDYAMINIFDDRFIDDLHTTNADVAVNSALSEIRRAEQLLNA